VKQVEYFAPSRAIRLIPEPGAEPRSDKYGFWYNIIEEFSHRKLTVSTDVLRAVMGLAQESAATLDDVYANGLWKNDLAKGILWKACGNTLGSRYRMAPARRTEQSAARAPSWSWASVEGCVSWYDHIGAIDQTSYLFEILSLEPDVNVSTYIASHSALLIRGVVKKYLSLTGADEPSKFDPMFVQDRVHAEVDLSEVSSCYVLQAAAAETLGGAFHECLILEPVQLERNLFRRIGVCQIQKAWAEYFFAGIDSTEIRIC